MRCGRTWTAPGSWRCWASSPGRWSAGPTGSCWKNGWKTGRRRRKRQRRNYWPGGGTAGIRPGGRPRRASAARRPGPAVTAAGPHDFPVLWLMRHGETEWSRDHRYTGLTDLELTPAGVQQARDAAAKLAGVRFRTVLTSPLVRARRTAELAGYPGAEVVPEAHEWDYGDYEGLQSAVIRAKDPSYLIWTHGVRGGESLQQVADRADHVIAKVLDGGDEAALGGGTFRRCFRGWSAGPGNGPGHASVVRNVRTAAGAAGGAWTLPPRAGRPVARDGTGRGPAFCPGDRCRLPVGLGQKDPAIAGWNL